MKVSDHFENWDNFTNKCSVSLHAVDGNGTVLWANDPELKFMGYESQEYVGRFIGDFHVDKDVIDDILAPDEGRNAQRLSSATTGEGRIDQVRNEQLQRVSNQGRGIPPHALLHHRHRRGRMEGAQRQ